MANKISDETIEYVGILAKLELSSEEKEEDAMDIDSLINEIQQGKGTDSENDSRH